MLLLFSPFWRQCLVRPGWPWDYTPLSPGGLYFNTSLLSAGCHSLGSQDECSVAALHHSPVSIYPCLSLNSQTPCLSPSWHSKHALSCWAYLSPSLRDSGLNNKTYELIFNRRHGDIVLEINGSTALWAYLRWCQSAFSPWETALLLTEFAPNYPLLFQKLYFLSYIPFIIS